MNVLWLSVFSSRRTCTTTCPYSVVMILMKKRRIFNKNHENAFYVGLTSIFDTFTIKERDIMQLVGPEKNNKK